MTRARYALVVSALVLASVPPPAAGTSPAGGNWSTPQAAATQPRAPEELLREARALFLETNWEAAIPILNALIADLSSKTTAPAAILAEALELRARARFNLRDTEGARQDFLTLLASVPSYTLREFATGETGRGVGPRVTGLFEELKRQVVGSLALTVFPADGRAVIDGADVNVSAAIPLAAGAHTLTVSRDGYRTATQRFVVVPAATAELTVTLERTAATIVVRTMPSGVEVLVNGVSRGKTRAEGNEAGSATAQASSSAFVITDLQPGDTRLEFRRDCYRPQRRLVSIDRLADIEIPDVTLEPATASVDIDLGPRARVYVDGEFKGMSPLSLPGVCEGTRIVEGRSAFGRFFRRLDVRAGRDERVVGAIKPDFAILTTLKPDAPTNLELRLAVERALEGLQSVTFYAPTDSDAGAAVPPDLLLDRADLDPQSVEARSAFSARREWSARLCRQLQSQAIAIVLGEPDKDNRILAALLASGSSRPDLVTIDLDDPRALEAALEVRPALVRPTLGLSVVDVLDATGALVVRVTPRKDVGEVGIMPGEFVIEAGGKLVTSAADLATAFSGQAPGTFIALKIRHPYHGQRSISLTLQQEPRLVSLDDRTLLFNALILYFQTLVATSAPPEQAIARLNLAVSLMAVQSWAAAREELEQVNLSPGPGVSRGTVAYLLGLCQEALSRVRDAEARFVEASQATDSLLTEDGPPVAELAQRRLEQLRQGR